MVKRVLIACHNATASGGDILSTLKGEEFTYDFMDPYDYRKEFIAQREEDYYDEMDDDEYDKFVSQPPKPEEYDRIEKEYFAKHPDRKQYTNWKDVPSNTYDYVFGMYCPTQELRTFTEPFGQIREDSLRALKPGGSFIMSISHWKKGELLAMKDNAELGIKDGVPSRDIELDVSSIDVKYPTPKGFVRTEKKLAAGQTDPEFPEFWEVHDKNPRYTKDRWDIKYTKVTGKREREEGGHRRGRRTVRRRKSRKTRKQFRRK